jgi:hypothetical protein
MVTSGRFFSRWFPVLLCAATTLVARAATDVRFSATLTPDLRDRAGLTQLTVDNVAIIDGLVRQDEAASKFKDNNVDHTRFSQRRTPRELQISGLDHLTKSQISVLDDLISQRISGINPAATAVASYITNSNGSATGTAVKPDLPAHKLDIHGEIGFTAGWGSGGSFTGGDVVLTYDDPAGRYGVLVAYSEYHGKGLWPCYTGYGAFPGYGPYGSSPFPATR